jgi:hypothetical protein
MGIEDFLILDERRKTLKHIGFALVEHIALLKSQVSDDPQPIEQLKPIAQGHSSRSRGKTAVPKRSWTQPDLDQQILAYKAKRASTYSELLNGVRAGRPGAKKTAQDTYGRNAIVRALGVKSPAMVTKSPAWQSIADELGLRSRKPVATHKPTQRIGLDIALEKQAEATSGTAIDDAIRRETIRLVRTSMPQAEAEATIEKLQRGEMSDDAAREVIRIYSEQQSDSRRNKVRQDA